MNIEEAKEYARLPGEGPLEVQQFRERAKGFIEGWNAALEAAAEIPFKGTATFGFYGQGPEAIRDAIRDLKVADNSNGAKDAKCLHCSCFPETTCCECGEA